MNDTAPTRLQRVGDSLEIAWSDGAHTRVAWQKLRKMCPCAMCNDERQKPVDPFRLLSDKELAAGAPAPVKMLPKGNYAYQIIWNDGHDTGIYTIEYLRQLSTPVELKE
ncbi:MAG: DUF971 domain-containing protein [Zavarzinella sp.]